MDPAEVSKDVSFQFVSEGKEASDADFRAAREKT